MSTPDWTDLAREGRTLAAIVAYRASVGIGLGEAKEAVERWVETNLPPSVGYQRAVKVGRRVACRLAEYAAGVGRELAYTIHVLAADENEHIGHPSLLAAELPEGRDGRDLVVVIELTGIPSSARRQAVLDALQRGARMVWVIDVEDCSIRVATQASRWSVWHDDAVFDACEVLPGFTCKVSDLFA